MQFYILTEMNWQSKEHNIILQLMQTHIYKPRFISAITCATVERWNALHPSRLRQNIAIKQVSAIRKSL